MNDHEILISIIIPNYNGEKVLPLCLESLFKQSFRKFEVILIDNGSSDNSIQICSIYKSKGLPINIISLRRNIGYSAAITLGALYAKGKYIFATNNDIIFERDFLSSIINSIESERKKDPSIVAASGLILHYPDKETIFYAGGAFSLVTAGYYILYGKNISKMTIQERNLLKKIRYTAFPSGAGALIDRKVFLSLGGYYPAYFAGIEEIDFGLQLYKKGLKAIFVPQSILYHIESFTFGERTVLTPLKLYLILRNLLIYYFRNYDLLRITMCIFAHIFVSLIILLLTIFTNKRQLVYSVIKAYSLFFRKDIKIIKYFRSVYQINIGKIFNFLADFYASSGIKKNIEILVRRYFLGYHELH